MKASLPQPNVPIVGDVKTGLIQPDWYQGLVSIFNRTGGSATDRVPAAKSDIWTPTDASGAGLTITTFSVRSSLIGSLQYITGTISYPVTADGSNAKIGGLPVATLNEAGVGGTFLIYYGTGPALLGLLVAGAQLFAIFTQAGVPVINSTLSGVSLRFQFFYPVA